MQDHTGRPGDGDSAGIGSAHPRRQPARRACLRRHSALATTAPPVPRVSAKYRTVGFTGL